MSNKSELFLIQDYLKKKKNFKPVFEIMVHPDHKENLIIDTWHKTSLEEKLIHLKQLYNSIKDKQA